MILSREKIRRGQTRLLDRIVCRNPSLGLDKRAEFFTKIFEKWLVPESHVLDIGGRWGFYDQPLRKRGHDVTILDVVKPQFQQAPVVVYDGRQIPFPDSSFDACLLITVLHHIRDVESVLKEAHRVTRKTLVVVEDLYHHRLGRWWTILRDRIYNLEFLGHPCCFKKSDNWIRIIENCGFRLVGEKQVYTWLTVCRILNGVFIFEKVPG